VKYAVRAGDHELALAAGLRVCPSCSSGSSFRRGTLMYLQCSACRYQCSLIIGTLFEAAKLPLTRMVLVMHLLTQAKIQR